MTEQLARLVQPFKSNLIHTNPSGGGSYVTHSVVEQKLLAVVGPFDMEVRELMRGHVAGIPANPNGKSERAKRGAPELNDAVVGAIVRLTVTIDGRRVSVDEVGDCESPHNWPHDGARAKDAVSDAFKRAAMRLGVGVHLWAQEEFFLFDYLNKPKPEVVQLPAEPPAANTPVQQNANRAELAKARAALQGELGASEVA